MKQFKSINSAPNAFSLLIFSLLFLSCSPFFFASGSGSEISGKAQNFSASNQNQSQNQNQRGENDRKNVPNPSKPTKRQKPPYASCPDSIETLAFAELQTILFILELWEIRNMTLDSSIRSQLLENIKEYIQDVESGFPSGFHGGRRKRIHSNLTVDSMNEMATSIAQNPLSVYRLLDRFVRKLPLLSRKARDAGLFNLQKDNKLVVKFMKVDLKKVNPPNASDILDSVRAILQLQTVYKISTIDLSLGNIPVVPGENQRSDWIKTGISLISDHCFEIGKVVATQGNVRLSAEWVARAIALLTLEMKTKETSIASETAQKQVEKLKAFKKAFKKIAKTHNDLFTGQTDPKTGNLKFKLKQEAKGLQLFHAPIGEEIIRLLLQGNESALEKLVSNYAEIFEKEREIRRQQFLNKHGELEQNWKLVSNMNLINFAFEEICAGRDFWPRRRRGHLFCWYEWKKHPFYFIGPMKMELLSREPDIFRIYNVIGPSLIHQMEQEGSGKYIRGTIVNPENPDDGRGNEKTFVDNYKIAMDWPIYDNMSVSWNIIFAHGKYLLNFRRSYHKLTKYSNFGIFRPHLDALCQGKFCLNPQERLANYLIYLSDVQSGGQTAFPLLGLGVKPVKGSAIVWYNVFGNGDPDSRTMHASCPVVLGKKFKMTQLVKLYQHFHQYKCPLQREQRFRVSVNGRSLN